MILKDLRDLLYEPIGVIIVKPLETVMVKKPVTTLEPTGKKTTDPISGNEVDAVEPIVEEKEVEASFQEGVVLATPDNWTMEFKVGDTIVYPKRAVVYFDLYRDSIIIRPHDVIAIKLTVEDETCRR